ncbi:uncharacterized protein [Scyliorhinus torazame]|uniref:uncharacterized protein isoform X3 n=1 Tax=Scyliorhinus torazame TaxID=75743 RepID=UPI003B59F875
MGSLGWARFALTLAGLAGPAVSDGGNALTNLFRRKFCGDPLTSELCTGIDIILNITKCEDLDCCYAASSCFRKTVNRTGEHVAYFILGAFIVGLVMTIIILLWLHRQDRRRAGEYNKKEVKSMMQELMAERRGSDIMPHKR